MPDPDKRRMRELKRAVKKRGNKHRRQQLKRDPEEAAQSEEDVGKHRSDRLNGLDNDSTRKKADSPQRREEDTKGHKEDD